MTEEEIKRFISQTEDDLVTAKKFLAMWRRRNQTPSMEDHALLPLNGAGGERQYGQITADVRAAIHQCQTRSFTIKDVELTLLTMNKKIDRPTIARCVNRLLLGKKPFIKVVKKGRGRKAAKYGKVT